MIGKRPQNKTESEKKNYFNKRQKESVTVSVLCSNKYKQCMYIDKMLKKKVIKTNSNCIHSVLKKKEKRQSN